MAFYALATAISAWIGTGGLNASLEYFCRDPTTNPGPCGKQVDEAEAKRRPPKEIIVTRIGLTLDEYLTLRACPHSGADPAIHAAAEQVRENMFPMNLAAASNHLRSRGYDCRSPMLEMLIERGVLTPASSDSWAQTDVDAAAEHFEDCQMFVPYAAMCQTLGCRYADFLRPLLEAAERESKKYGRHIPNDDQYFVMHRIPPRGVTDANGHLADIKPAVISFSLCDDIRERLERGEEV